jgi:hypothetical protein
MIEDCTTWNLGVNDVPIYNVPQTILVDADFKYLPRSAQEFKQAGTTRHPPTPNQSTEGESVAVSRKPRRF